MAYAENIQCIELDADASIAVYTGPPGARGTSGPYWGKQYRFVKVTGEHTAGLAVTTANEVPVGVLQNKPQNVGEAGQVAISGVSRIQLGGTVAAGAAVKTDTTGRAVTATLPGDIALVLGVLTKGGAVGQLGAVLLRMN